MLAVAYLATSLRAPELTERLGRRLPALGGLVPTPLTTTVLVSLPAEQAGAASGALSTMQNVGNALGVALIGVVFFDAVHVGYAHAFVLSTLVLAGVGLALAALTRLLPRQVRG